MKTVKEYNYSDLLDEPPVAVLDDWGGFKAKKETFIGKKAFDRGIWELQAKLKTRKGKPVEIYKLQDENTYILGAWAHEGEKPGFVVITQLETYLRKDIKSQLKYKNPIQMKKVETGKNFQDQGYAKLLYSWFISQGFTVVSDIVQFVPTINRHNSTSKL
jgi:hypothetical protein